MVLAGAVVDVCVLRTPMMKWPVVFSLAIVLDVVFIAGSYVELPHIVERGVFILLHKCTLALALFVVVMFRVYSCMILKCVSACSPCAERSPLRRGFWCSVAWWYMFFCIPGAFVQRCDSGKRASRARNRAGAVRIVASFGYDFLRHRQARHEEANLGARATVGMRVLRACVCTCYVDARSCRHARWGGCPG